MLYGHIRYDQVLCLPVVPASNIIGVGFIKVKDMEIAFIERGNKVRVFDDKDKLRSCPPQYPRKPPVVLLCEPLSLIVGKIRIVRWVQKHEVRLPQF